MDLRGKRRARAREAASDPAGEPALVPPQQRLALMMRALCAAFGVTSYYKPQEAECRRHAHPAR